MIVKSQPVRSALLGAALISTFFCAVGCGDDDASIDSGAPDEDSGHEETPPLPEDSGTPDSGGPDPHDAGPDASEPMPDGSAPDASDHDSGTDSGTPEEDAAVPLTLGGLTVSTTAEQLDSTFDLFSSPGHRFWIEVNPQQLQRLNNEGCCGGGGGEEGDIYQPGQGTGSTSAATFADHVLVQHAESEEVADYGKVEIDLVGQSTHRYWTENSIPNVRVDADEFVQGKRIGTFEHFRLNNSLVGTIIREHVVHDVYRALGYPALRSTYAFLGSNVWGDDTWVPMTLIEMYKRRFCKDNQELLGGDCENMWDFYGDIGDGYYGGYEGGLRPLAGSDGGITDVDTSLVPDEWCQVAECDNTRFAELITVLADTHYGAGFKAALADYIDWDRFHQFQCLSWILETTDDPIHAANNNIIIERDDGKFVWAPYSVDISTSGPWGGGGVPLTGSYSIARGCQLDQDCWADMIEVCEDVIARFDDLNPEEMVDEAVTQLTAHNMMRYNDDQHAETMRAFFVQRQAVLADQLEQYRYLPDENGNCGEGLERCNDGGCGTPEACEGRMCEGGAVWCESLQRCVYSLEEECPSCTETSPYYCNDTESCVADELVCQAACNDRIGFHWCEAWQECAPIEYECPELQDGGAAGGGGGGAGGMGGIPIPID